MIICDNDEFKEAAEFYAAKLGIPDTTIIAVGIYPNMPIDGYCEYHDDDAIPYFIVGIKEEEEDSSYEDPLSILAHEMVHVKQYATGALVDHGKYCMWNGKRYEEYAANSEEYFFSPWEVEAYGMQVGLYRMYCRSIEE